MIPPIGFYRFRLKKEGPNNRRGERDHGVSGSASWVGGDCVPADTNSATCLTANTALGTSRARVCGLCVVAGEGTHYCWACGEYLCNECSSIHGRLKIFAEHNIQPLQTLGGDHATRSTNHGRPNALLGPGTKEPTSSTLLPLHGLGRVQTREQEHGGGGGGEGVGSLNRSVDSAIVRSKTWNTRGVTRSEWGSRLAPILSSKNGKKVDLYADASGVVTSPSRFRLQQALIAPYEWFDDVMAIPPHLNMAKPFRAPPLYSPTNAEGPQYRPGTRMMVMDSTGAVQRHYSFNALLQRSP
mmetsp:Transcript_91980/g.148520  ORF Transcript_91980/g.148520 Transcript_91980/m.148520 type:complete len:298 (+) Transcript_91980:290-1183(+)